MSIVLKLQTNIQRALIFGQNFLEIVKVACITGAMAKRKNKRKDIEDIASTWQWPTGLALLLLHYTANVVSIGLEVDL